MGVWGLQSILELALPPRRTRREASPPPEGHERTKSLSGVSRMSTPVCCELSRAKEVMARDARLRWDLIGENCACYSGVVSTFSYSDRSVARQQLLATSLRLDNRAPLGAGHFSAPDLMPAKSSSGGLNRTCAAPSVGLPSFPRHYSSSKRVRARIARPVYPQLQ